jgi:hypothetical protein
MLMTREQLAHVLRAASRIAQDPDVLVIGSQSILGSYSEDELPPEATGSMEVDTAFFVDPDEAKSDLVDAMIGELSQFHNEFGYYPQGVSVNTGVFPAGWIDRLVTYETESTAPGRGLCLEPHDCVLAKLVRFEEKDQDFAAALVTEGLIDLENPGRSGRNGPCSSSGHRTHPAMDRHDESQATSEGVLIFVHKMRGD